MIIYNQFFGKEIKKLIITKIFFRYDHHVIYYQIISFLIKFKKYSSLLIQVYSPFSQYFHDYWKMTPINWIYIFLKVV